MARSAERPLFVHRHDPRAHVPASRSIAHEHCVIALQLAGRAELDVGGTAVEFGPGDCVLVPAGSPHRPISSTDAETLVLGFCATCWGLHDDPSLLAPFQRIRRSGASAARPPADRRAHVEHLLGEIDREVRGEGAPSALRALLVLVLVEVGRWYRSDAPPARSASGVVADALAYVEAHCLEEITLDDVAAAAGRSPSHLTASVRRATGRTVQAWITAGRMGEARRLLEHSSLAIDAIAARVGYADPRHFYRVFREAHGASPGAWRRERVR